MLYLGMPSCTTPRFEDIAATRVRLVPQRIAGFTDLELSRAIHDVRPKMSFSLQQGGHLRSKSLKFIEDGGLIVYYQNRVWGWGVPVYP